MQTLSKQDVKATVRQGFRRPQANHISFNRDRISFPQKVPSRWLRQTNAATHKALRYAFEQAQQATRSVSVYYPIDGSNVVEEIQYAASDSEVEDGRIWINQTQYFEGISIAVWNYTLGGRQLCQKWLQDRQGSTLSENSIQHYQQLVTILKDVVEVMAGVDAIFQARQLNCCAAGS